MVEDTVTLTADSQCYAPEETATLTITAEVSTDLVGAQFFMDFDAAAWQVTAIEPGEDWIEIIENSDNVGGTIQYAVGLYEPVQGVVTVATITMTAGGVEDCAAWMQFDLAHAPPTQLSGPGGQVLTVAFDDDDVAGVSIDNNPPAFVNCPEDLTIECDEDVPDAPDVTATDTCDPEPVVAFNEETTAGDCPNESFIVRTWTAVDACGNSATCSQTITVVDSTAPTFDTPCPDEITLDTVADSCTAVATWEDPTATDNCSADVSVTCDPPSGSTFDIGYTPIICTAVDDCDSSNTCTFGVTVVDRELPNVVCPSDIIEYASEECLLTIDPGLATCTDNCGACTVSCRRDDHENCFLDAYPVGTTTLTWIARDSSGNPSSSCRQTVTVIDDQSPTLTGCPVFSYEAVAKPDQCSEPVAISAFLQCDDNCPCGIGCARDDGLDCFDDPYPVGVTTIVWFASDAVCDGGSQGGQPCETDADCPDDGVCRGTGNTTECAPITVTVHDNTAPSIDCPPDPPPTPTAEGTCAALVDPGSATCDDNCPDCETTCARSDGLACYDPENPDPYPVGTTTLTWTATDASGNTEVCTQIVEVFDDASPEISCPADATVECGSGIDPVQTGEPTVTDNCDDTLDVTFADVLESTGCGDTAVINRTWTATDAAGNPAECIQVITIVDTTPPDVVDLVVSNETVDEECSATVSFSAMVTDDCCLDADDVTVEVILVGGNAQIEPTTIQKIQSGDGLVEVTGSMVVYNLDDCAATVAVTILATDCCGNEGGSQNNVMDGRWSESHVGGGAGQPGNVVHAASWDGTALATAWELLGPTLDDSGAVLIDDTIDGDGNGQRVYFTNYVGGTLTADSALWGETGSVTAELTRYEHVTHHVYAGGSVDWGASWTDAEAVAPISDGPVLHLTARADFVGVGAGPDPDYPSFGGGAAAGQWGDVRNAVLRTTPWASGAVTDGIPPEITCPDGIAVLADAGSDPPCAVIDPGMPTYADNCCDSCAPTCVSDDGDGCGERCYPVGSTVLTWTLVDDCGNTASCTQHIAVSELRILVDLELAGVIHTPVTRCMTFELFDCAAPGDSVVVEMDVAFPGVCSGGGSDGNPCLSDADCPDGACGSAPTAAASVEVSATTADYNCITVRDRQHTLRATADILSEGGVHSATFAALSGGNLNDDCYIDIVDFSIMVEQWNSEVTADTFCSTGSPLDYHADINGDGAVDILDFSFISVNFLHWSEPNCCGADPVCDPEQPLRGDAPDGPRRAISVKELRRLGLGGAGKADLNGDNMVDDKDIAALLTGAPPAEDGPAPARKRARVTRTRAD